MELTMSKYLFQAVKVVNDETHFVSNAVVSYLFKKSNLTITDLLEMKLDPLDIMHFLQLIGMNVEEFYDFAEKHYPKYREEALRIAAIADKMANGSGMSDARMEVLEEDADMIRQTQVNLYQEVCKTSDEIARLWQAFHDRDDK
jgi:hypothetical protein